VRGHDLRQHLAQEIQSGDDPLTNVLLAGPLLIYKGDSCGVCQRLAHLSVKRIDPLSGDFDHG